MAFDPNKPPEYNINGDRANGTAGSMTPGSVKNAAMHSKPTAAKDGFASMLDSAVALNAKRRGPATAPQRPMQPGHPHQGPIDPAIGRASGQVQNAISGQQGGGYNTGIVPPNQGGSYVPPPAQGSGYGSVTGPGGKQPTNNPVPNPQPTIQTPAPDPRPTPTIQTPAGPPRPPGTEDPGIAAQWYAQHPGFEAVTRSDVETYRNNPQGMDFIQWWNAGNRGSATPAAPAPQVPNRPNAPGPVRPSPSGPGAGPVGGGPAPARPQVTTTPPAGAPPTIQNFDPNAIKYEDFATALRKQFDPEFQRQQEDLMRQMRHEASVTGAINSGGYGSTVGDALGGLLAKQGSHVGEMAFQGQQAALDRALKDNQFKNQFEMEKWINSNKFELEKRGIDVERYKADMGYRAAVAQANATKAAAASGANAAMYGANLGFQSNVLDADVRREGNLMQNMLGWAALGPDWARLMMGGSPENFLNGNGSVPGNIYVKP